MKLRIFPKFIRFLFVGFSSIQFMSIRRNEIHVVISTFIVIIGKWIYGEVYLRTLRNMQSPLLRRGSVKLDSVCDKSKVGFCVIDALQAKVRGALIDRC